MIKNSFGDDGQCSPLKIVATGDSFITRRINSSDPDLSSLNGILGSGHAVFTNFETTAHDNQGPPAAVSGGTWAIAAPGVVSDLKSLGFNIVSTANNHAMDYSAEGLLATAENLKQAGIVFAGTGSNLAEASGPSYLEAPRSRIGIIGVTTTFDESWVAGDQRPDLKGRPGVSAIGHQKRFRVSEEKLSNLKAVADTTDINAEFDYAVSNGYKQPWDESQGLYFGGHTFSTTFGPSTQAVASDKRRVERAVERARTESDYVLVSIHAHEMRGTDDERPSEFIEELCRSFIDAGADAVIGHGPHIIRGIEIYEGRPIFYSLGNFIFQNETVSQLPAEFYDSQGLGPEHTVHEALAARSDHWTKGYAVDPRIWESVIAVWTDSDEALEISLHPIDLGWDEPYYRRGIPRIASNAGVLERLRDLSSPYGTHLSIDQGVGRIVVGKSTGRF